MIDLTKHITLPHMRTVRHLLLEDHTHYDPHNTDYHAILWVTNSYTNHQPSEEMTDTAYTEIQPRYSKTQATQDNRRKTRGEVFTPTWLCNHMNNQADNTHFNNSNFFNTEDIDSHTWRSPLFSLTIRQSNRRNHTTHAPYRIIRPQTPMD